MNSLNSVLIIEKENRQIEKFHLHSLNLEKSVVENFISFGVDFELSVLDSYNLMNIFEFPEYFTRLDGLIISDEKFLNLKGIYLSQIEHIENYISKIRIICDYCEENKDTNLAKSLRRDIKLESLGI
jgi:hypothetical protein